MAENERRSYRDPRWRNAEQTSRAEADDPLAELARLIGQGATNRPGRDRRLAEPEHADDRDGESGRSDDHAAPDERFRESPRQVRDERYSPSDDAHYEQDPDPDYRAGRDQRYGQAAQTNSAPPPRASRFRQEPEIPMPSRRDVDHGEGDEGDDAVQQETADWRERPSDDDAESHYADEYEDEGHAADAYAYDDEYSEDQIPRRRSGFVLVAAIFALAVLGTAGAFAYRAVFGGPVLPALPPIIKAEGGPNKIIPSGANSQGEQPVRDADAPNAGSRERLVSREERPVDIPPPVTSPAPRPVSTVPVFPDPPRMGGPGAVVGYSASLPPSNLPPSNSAASTEPPSAPAMTMATAPNPAASTAPAASSSATLSGSSPTAGLSAAPAPKKIRTVTIHTDQAAADGPVSSTAAPRSGTQSQSPNGPLSIVPSANDAPAPVVRPRSAAAPQLVPVNKPPANETASAAPAAAVSTASGGYAVQVSSQRSEEEAQSSFRDLQAKYPGVLGGRTPIIRRADLGAKGIFFRAMVGPFGSADQATELCSNLKAAGGSCLVQKN
jgi:sporulation related protein